MQHITLPSAGPALRYVLTCDAFVLHLKAQDWKCAFKSAEIATDKVRDNSGLVTFCSIWAGNGTVISYNSGACKGPSIREPFGEIITGWKHFLLPNQQCQSSEGRRQKVKPLTKPRHLFHSLLTTGLSPCQQRNWQFGSTLIAQSVTLFLPHFHSPAWCTA